MDYNKILENAKRILDSFEQDKIIVEQFNNNFKTIVFKDTMACFKPLKGGLYNYEPIEKEELLEKLNNNELDDYLTDEIHFDCKKEILIKQYKEMDIFTEENKTVPVVTILTVGKFTLFYKGKKVAEFSFTAGKPFFSCNSNSLGHIQPSGNPWPYIHCFQFMDSTPNGFIEAVKDTITIKE